MKKRLVPVFILLVAVAIAATLIITKPKAKPVEVKEKAWLVAADGIQRQTLAPTFILYGRVESLWHSDLTAGVAADVVDIRVIDGSRVKKGDVLLTLDDRDTRLLLAQREAELAEAEAKIQSEITKHQANLKSLPSEKRLLELTQAEVKRLQGLVKRKVSAQSALDTARQSAERQAIALAARQQLVLEHKARLAELNAKLARAEAMRDQAQIELDRTSLISPFNGVVTSVNVSPGKNVRVGESLIQLYDEDSLVIRGQVPNRYLGMIRNALQKEEKVRLQGELDKQPIKATLVNLAGEANGSTGGVEGLFELDSRYDDIQHGRFVHLDLVLPEQQDLIAIPHESIYGTDKVYIVDDEHRMRARNIERVGEIRLADGSSQTLIRSNDLNPGDQLVTTQLPNAVDGLLVRVAGEQ